MRKTLRLCFRADKKLELALDTDGTYAEGYLCVKVKDVDSYTLPEEEYKNLQDAFRVMLAEEFNYDIHLLTPITLDEYLDGTTGED